ncbi:MAG: hypothetical protein R3B06_14175 [Kofleriaceae bacterium]
MRTLLIAALALAATTAAPRIADACRYTRDPYAIVLGDPQAAGDRPVILIAQLPPDAPLALAGPSGDVSVDRVGAYLRPRAALTAGAAYRVAVRGGGRDRVLATFTVAPAAAAPAPSWDGVDLIRAGVEAPRTTCDGHGFALTVAVRPAAGSPAPTGFLYVYDRRPSPAAPLRGLRGVVAATAGEVQLGQLGARTTFAPRWDDRRPPRAVWLALGDAAGHVGAPRRLVVPASSPRAP